MNHRRCGHLSGWIRGVAVATVAVLFGIFLQLAEGGHTRGFIYTIEQAGGVPQGVIPLRGTVPVETFYGYPGGATRSATGLERSDTSLLFLYEDAVGKVSLVVIHDANDGSGGKAVFDLTGIPEGTGFVVRDDPEDGPFDISLPGGTATVTWAWSNVNTDGGALGGSLEKRAWTITITPQFPASGGTSPGSITAWKFLTGRLDNPTAIALDMTDPITIRAIPGSLQVVTSARLTAEGRDCQVATPAGPRIVTLGIVVEGTLPISGQQIIAPDGSGGTLITFDGEIAATNALTFTVAVDGGTPLVVPAVQVEGHFTAVAHATPPVVRFTTGPVIELSGPGFVIQLPGTTASTGPWKLIATDAKVANFTISPDFPQIGWTAQIAAETRPALTFANVSGCDIVGTGQRNTTLRSGSVDIKPGLFPNPVVTTGAALLPVAILGADGFDVTTINATTLEIDDDRVPGNGVAPARVEKTLEDVNGDGFLDLSLKFATPALNRAGLLGNKRLFVTGAIGDGGPQVLGSDAICIWGKCAP